jgi:hypothetical protein
MTLGGAKIENKFEAQTMYQVISKFMNENI